MKISKLQPSQRVQGRWLVYLEDGSLLRVGEGDVVSFALHTGMELDAVTVEALQRAGHLGQVREKALSLLAARPLSKKELMDKLTARPRDREKEPIATREEAEDVAARLEELGYLDDAAYARMVGEHYAAKGYGPGRVREELYRRGVPREYWEEAQEVCQGPEAAIDAFLERKLRSRTPDRRELKRASDALLRRGFRWADISAGLRRYGAEIEEESSWKPDRRC